MRAALVERNGTIFVRRTAPTPAHDDAPAALVDLIRGVIVMSGQRTPGHAVVGLPGPVDYDRGMLLWAPHLPESWTTALTNEELTNRLDLPVFIANDADLAAVGEAAFGAGKGIPDVAYLTISTGIGAGIVCGGRLLRGHRSLAEVGHTVIDLNAWCAGRPCTLEQLGSGSGMAFAASEAGMGDLDARAIAKAACSGNLMALDIWNRAVAACAVGVGNLVMAFSPITVVVGGGVGRQEDFFAALRAMVDNRPAHRPTDLSLVPSSLGDVAGLAGAAGWMAATSCASEWDSGP